MTVTTQKQPIIVYYWGTPNGFKITIMLEELGVPYTVKPINISSEEQFERKFLAISPNNKIPAIVDPEGSKNKPIAIFESGAILQYLGRKFNKFYPQEEPNRTVVEQWLFWQMAGLGPMCGQSFHFLAYAPEKIPYAIARYTNEVNRLFGVLDKQLEDRQYIAGDYSIADIACVGWISAWQRLEQDITDFANLERWLNTMLARPAVKRGIDV